MTSGCQSSNPEEKLTRVIKTNWTLFYVKLSNPKHFTRPICITSIRWHASPFPEDRPLVPMWLTPSTLSLEPWRGPRPTCTQLALGLLMVCWKRDFRLGSRLLVEVAISEEFDLRSCNHLSVNHIFYPWHQWSRDPLRFGRRFWVTRLSSYPPIIDPFRLSWRWLPKSSQVQVDRKILYSLCHRPEDEDRVLDRSREIHEKSEVMTSNVVDHETADRLISTHQPDENLVKDGVSQNHFDRTVRKAKTTTNAEGTTEEESSTTSVYCHESG